ncbi:PhzF family phenazine biosynthesis protein [Proteus mirabilis]|uniref:PhzF family phenazine biosynthesis protein n=1 Tax=Proteus mirabilis TaxID=584 RepID=UPI00073D085C|nr:PhzF family phenazine biosynthesis protein [Proteus mirabilis]AZG99484.1 PhzF family phenazine biosynthesis protein [Proteus mirabilis]KSX99969.1 phenazine biosynthesis protein PhzF [Proteus mirabilis]MBG6040335.1 PhzF family phenazine biosynthesis protein [Proteus mirabilis]MBS3851591.1 PhzF family phenazine biosynthesis protein [Proteus mirabilis]MCI9767406.1 PhzF family phenazine biosynthesis protein [Proteus mirabilis]
MQNQVAQSMKNSIKVYLVNSFTRDHCGGNPAGVVLNPPKLTTEQKIAIAQQVGFSETAFVYPDDETDFKVDFFTAEGEVDFCGHATLAVFFTLSTLKLLKPSDYSQKTKAGILTVTINHDNIVMEQTLPITRKGPSVNDVAMVLGIAPEVIEKTNLPIEIVSTGLNDIFVPIQFGYLDALQPDYKAIAALSHKFDTIGFHVFELSHDQNITAHCRNFAPRYGINEESATGSSSGALGCYLVHHLLPNKKQFLFEQGRAMQCSSLIDVFIDSTAKNITRVQVGGKATLIGTKIIEI